MCCKNSAKVAIYIVSSMASLHGLSSHDHSDTSLWPRDSHTCRDNPAHEIQPDKHLHTIDTIHTDLYIHTAFLYIPHIYTAREYIWNKYHYRCANS